MVFLGIEIGGTKLQLVLADAHGNIRERRKFAVKHEEGATAIREQIGKTVPELSELGSLAGVGVGFGGPVDWQTGRICRSHHVEGWSEFDLGGWLRDLSGGAPVRVDNDANVAALGEALAGAGVGFNPVFYVTLGSGVGGGLVIDGEIYHDMTPGESEIGHVRLDRSGTILEARCSGWAVDAKIRKIKQRQPGGLLAQLSRKSDRGEAKCLGAALAQADPDAISILQETAEALALGLSHVVHLMHPAVIVLGGGLSGVGEPLRSAVASALPGFIMDAFQPGSSVLLTRLGEHAVPVGAVYLAIAAQHPMPLFPE